MNWMFIEDGYTATKTLELEGLPKFVVRYRPALHGAKRQYQQAITGRGEAVAKADMGLIEKYVDTIDGNKIDPAKLHLLRPNIVSALLDLILGYTVEDQGADLKNSATG